MYEKADKNSISACRVAARLIAEYRAGMIQEQRSTTRENGKAILDSFKATAEKAEADIKRLTRKLAALDVDITRLQMRDTLRNAQEIQRKKQERADLVKRISALHAIRTRCLKQVGA